MVIDNAPGHPWTTPGPLLFTKSWRRYAKVVQSGSRWSTVVQSGPGSTRRQKQLFNFFADVFAEARNVLRMMDAEQYVHMRNGFRKFMEREAAPDGLRLEPVAGVWHTV